VERQLHFIPVDLPLGRWTLLMFSFYIYTYDDHVDGIQPEAGAYPLFAFAFAIFLGRLMQKAGKQLRCIRDFRKFN
jgi:hypothetical protein